MQFRKPFRRAGSELHHWRESALERHCHLAASAAPPPGAAEGLFQTFPGLGLGSFQVPRLGKLPQRHRHSTPGLPDAAFPNAGRGDQLHPATGGGVGTNALRLGWLACGAGPAAESLGRGLARSPHRKALKQVPRTLAGEGVDPAEGTQVDDGLDEEQLLVASA